MIMKVYYAESSELLNVALKALKKCTKYLKVENLEMNYNEITLVCKSEKMALVEAILAPYV